VLTYDVQVLLRQQRITRAQQSAAEVHVQEVGPVIVEEPVAKVLTRQIAGIPLLPATVLTLGAAQLGPFVGRPVLRVQSAQRLVYSLGQRFL